MRLNDLSDNKDSRRARKRVGRGIGSGTGKTAARGHKGQKSRSGVSLLGFEGGQMPLFRRLPKGGFTNIFRKRYRVINLDVLQRAVELGKLDPAVSINEATLVEAGIIKSVRDGVRILAKGKLNTKLKLHVTGASKSAIEAIENVGGSIIIVDKLRKESGSPIMESRKGKGVSDSPSNKDQGTDKE